MEVVRPIYRGYRIDMLLCLYKSEEKLEIMRNSKTNLWFLNKYIHLKQNLLILKSIILNFKAKFDLAQIEPFKAG